MDLKEFVHNLHFHVDKVSPPQREVDWNDAPLPYKVYRKLPVTPLPAEVPLVLSNCKPPLSATLGELGQLLWYSFGLCSVSQGQVAQGGGSYPAVAITQSMRRFVPSGGALYPSELYVYVKPTDAKSGVYHYDSAHHSLTLLREGDFDSYLAKGLGHRCDIFNCFGVVFVSTVFWRNYFKYHQFAYRLQAVDAGVVIGQLLEVCEGLGIHPTVHFQFLDDALNHLLGFTKDEESTYAVIGLSSPDANQEGGMTCDSSDCQSTDLCREIPNLSPQEYVRSKKIVKDSLLCEMNNRSRLESSRHFTSIQGEGHVGLPEQIVELPVVARLQEDFSRVCRARYSPGHEFVQHPVDAKQVASLFYETWQSFVYASDLMEESGDRCERVHLYGCLFSVTGIPDGAYRYDPQRHALQLIADGDYRKKLQRGMVMDNVNLLTVPLCLHVTGALDHMIPMLGYRGYRVQQMEAGMLLQRLLLTAAALGMNGHPLLGFESRLVDDLYHLEDVNETALIQVPIGACRPRPKLEGWLRA